MKKLDVEMAKMGGAHKKTHLAEDPFLQRNDNANFDIDLHLPNVIILVSDNVRLIRNNSIPML